MLVFSATESIFCRITSSSCSFRACLHAAQSWKSSLFSSGAEQKAFVNIHLSHCTDCELNFSLNFDRTILKLLVSTGFMLCIQLAMLPLLNKKMPMTGDYVFSVSHLMDQKSTTKSSYWNSILFYSLKVSPTWLMWRFKQNSPIMTICLD